VSIISLKLPFLEHDFLVMFYMNIMLYLNAEILEGGFGGRLAFVGLLFYSTV